MLTSSVEWKCESLIGWWNVNWMRITAICWFKRISILVVGSIERNTINSMLLLHRVLKFRSSRFKFEILSTSCLQCCAYEVDLEKGQTAAGNLDLAWRRMLKLKSNYSTTTSFPGFQESKMENRMPFDCKTHDRRNLIQILNAQSSLMPSSQLQDAFQGFAP